MLARLIAAAACVALLPSPADATTPFADYCEGDVCFQGKVQTQCLTSDARRLMRTIADRFGKIEVASACDGRHARRSAHYVGKAFDFRPFQGSRAEIVAFLKASPDVGGVGTYPNGLIHADVADRKMAWHGRGGRAWPIGIDGTYAREAPVVVASAGPPEPSSGLAAALRGIFEPVRPATEPSTPSEAPPLAAADVAKAASVQVPLPPPRPAVLLAAASPGAPADAAVAAPTDFAAVLRGPLAPSSPVLLEEHSPETAAAREAPAPVSFYREDAAPMRARMIAFAGLR